MKDAKSEGKFGLGGLARVRRHLHSGAGNTAWRKVTSRKVATINVHHESFNSSRKPAPHSYECLRKRSCVSYISVYIIS